MYETDLLEKCKKWVECNFSLIPTELLEKAYKNDPDAIAILATSYEYEETPLFPMWGYVFVPDDPILADLIEKNVDKVTECGFIIYETPEIGLYLGINGGGYDFYEAHWLPLYKLFFK